MNLELVTVGTELLLGFTVDSNAVFLGQALGEIGIRVIRRTTVEDDAGQIGAAVREALDRTGFVVVSGGLGPTHDDVTREAVAAVFGAPLEFDPAVWNSLVERFARLGRPLADRNRCQAEVPRGATILPNPRGTAPGLWLAGPPGEAILLPGVPAELRGLTLEEVVPRLLSRKSGTTVRSLLLRTTGISESAVADRLAPVLAELAPLSCASLPGIDGVDLRLTAWGLPPEQSAPLLEQAADRLAGPLGHHVYGRGDADLAGELLRECRARGWHLAIAESCTGGMLGERITAVPGSSDVFTGGVIAYADRIKEDFGVPGRILAAHGAVSEETAAAMAEAARDRFGVDLAVSVTGIAGPAGGSGEKPVGLVCGGIAGPGHIESFRMRFPGSRRDIRARACQFALWKAWLRVKETPERG